jgi:hypothetical protein
MYRPMLCTALVAWLSCTAVACVCAADSTATSPAVTVSGAVTGLYSPMSDLGEGEVEWSAVTITGSVKRQFVPAFSASLALGYHEEYWAFRSSGAGGGSSFWGEFQRPSVALNFSLALSPTILVGVTPGAEWPAAPSVSTADALTYGATFSALKVFTPKFVLGGGVNAYRQFYNVKTSLFVIINWRLTEKLRIANALPAGPEGGAGVELRYAPNPAWELAAGGVSRSSRFHLAETGPYAGGIGETSTIPAFARVSRIFSPKTRIDLYAGGLFNGSIKVKDSAGSELENEKWGPAPALALTVSGKF